MNPQMNRLLQSRAEVDEATQWLKDNNLHSHGLSCKDVDLYLVAEDMKQQPEGISCVDLGADGSWILWNAVRMGMTGRKCGIDLIVPEMEYGEIEMIKGDLMNTPYPDESFHYATSMSVIEHNVSFEAFAKETHRILKPGGTLIVSTDYWDPSPDTSHVKLYNLPWNVLDKAEVLRLCEEMTKVGMVLTSDIDFTQGEDVINDRYCSPSAGIAYTFLFLKFIKQ